jgi:ADP-ribose pyrophosphatase YjhB (NUDIX family)
MEKEKNKKEKECFLVIVLAIIFDPEKRKILIGKRENDPYIKELSWVFPGGRLTPNETEEQTIKRKIKQETGLEVENLGTVFSRIFPEKKEFFLIYNLYELIKGKEKPSGDLKELKWVSPDELQNYFTTSFDPRLKEYILNLK